MLPKQSILGSRVKELRKAKKMTLQVLAREAGLSASYLSQLERNEATPSIRALSVIARSLGVGVNWFFPDPNSQSEIEDSIVVRKERRRALRFESGIKDELLSPSLSGQLEMVLCTFEPGASSGELYSHDGEQAGYVSEGQLLLRVDEERYLLNTGDSFHFNSKRPHGYHNPSASQTVVVWSITPPHY